ncbi:MAG: hypothetical protein BRC58_05215 [Cyanobacteria bacterium QS_8_64_29]|nr:MAG: hypothetical protein BRC58_05215 [Cyanobacteria bacterium QS_8_64_29]
MRVAAGLAVALWGLSKLIFLPDWVGAYQNFYATIPGVVVTLLGIVQILIGAGIVFEIYRKPAAWIGVVFAVVNLLNSLFKIDNIAQLGPPPPWGVKIIWFFFDPLVILLLLIGVAYMPKPASEGE